MIAPDLNLVAEVFSEAARLPNDQRAEFLDQRCAGDRALRDEVARLLHFHEQSSVFDKPMLGSMLHFPDGCDVSGSDQRIDKYRLVKTIGAGLNSVVYLAEQDEPVKRSVALKVLRWHDGDGRGRARFRLEQQALALLNHPSIVPILESGATTDGQPFFVMRFVDGAPITTFCQQHGLSQRERLRLFLDVTDAVHSAHLQGVHHRDLKPSNVLVEPCEPHARIALIDLGIARIEASPGATIGANTVSGQLVGSLAYMAPEQLDYGWRPRDARVDVFSLGCLLFELLANAQAYPVTPDESFSSLIARRKAIPPRLRDHGRPADKRLEAIVARALAPEPAQRYASAASLADDIRAFLDDRPVSARPFLLHEHTWMTVRRKPALFAVVATATVAVLALLIALDRQHTNAQISQSAARETARVITQTVIPEMERTIGTSDKRAEIYAALHPTLERLAQENPDEREVQLSFAKLLAAEGGDLLIRQSFERAKARFQEGREIVEALLLHMPDDIELIREQAFFVIRMGDVEQGARELGSALSHYENAHRILETMHRRSPQHVGAMNDLYWSHHRLGVVKQTLGNRDEARDHFATALELAYRLLDAGEKEEKARWCLLKALAGQDKAAAWAGDVKAAREFALATIEQAELLLGAAPRNILYLPEMVTAHARAGNHASNLGALDAATGHYQSAEQFVSLILDVDPDDEGARRFKTGLVRCHAHIATKRGDFTSAERLVDEYLALVETTPFPGDERIRARTLGWNIKLQIALGRDDRHAVKHAAHEIEQQVDDLLDSDSVSVAAWVPAAESSAELALQGHMPVEKALRIARSAYAVDPSGAMLLVLGNVLRTAGLREEACESYERALEITAPLPSPRRTQIEGYVQECRDAGEAAAARD